ncbi:hypothetical protein [Bradyrhizobium sp. SZCCHNPS1003]|uniref:hypothetical protein n=1 Tax=Bradyrhizobium sp. SZCCHNPS1003 TaxID=3057330 RepID=UPI0028E9F0BC|nr:hypothetical protein [Bradyrhizobium sp. SZCCHNPS1003]
MENQTKIGTGAAACITLLALLEPHLYEPYSPLIFVIYGLLGLIVVWGLLPVIRNSHLGRLDRMWPQYLMVAGGGLFFVGLVAFLQMNVSPSKHAADAPRSQPAEEKASSAPNNSARNEGASRESSPVPGQNVGILKPPIELIYSAKESGPIPLIQIGSSGVVLGPPESAAPYNELQTNEYLQVLMPALEATDFRIETIGGELKVSTQIADENGRLIAAIERNEWKVASAPQSWDRNYNESALEVKDDRGHVVLQIRLLPDRLQLQGVWPTGSQGRAAGLARVVLRKDPDGSGAQFTFLPSNPKADMVWPKIEPIFKYPSELHLGELDLPRRTALEKFQVHMSDVAGVGRATSDITMRLPDGSNYPVKVAIYRSWMSKKTFVALYVPGEAPALKAISRFSNDYKDILNFFNTRFHAVGHVGKRSIDQSELTFSGALYVFHQSPISTVERSTLLNEYRAKGLSLTLLGGDGEQK